MEWKLFLTIFASIFIAEMADKTQLATMLFAANREISRVAVFLAATSALALTSAIAVAAGALLSEVLNPRVLATVAGAGFILIGVWTLWHGWRIS